MKNEHQYIETMMWLREDLNRIAKSIEGSYYVRWNSNLVFVGSGRSVHVDAEVIDSLYEWCAEGEMK